jgi:hypothetical protein
MAPLQSLTAALVARLVVTRVVGAARYPKSWLDERYRYEQTR